jgi:uncharacterized protein (DUF4415 family)
MDWERFDALTPEEAHAAALSDPDAHPTDEAFWEGARVVWPQEREKKQSLTVRLDADVLRWFRRRGAGYQTHINAVLRAYVEAQKTKTGNQE